MPRLLDLFCGAGGASRGYADAGWDVVGVDIAPQPRYPYEFIQADALAVALDGFDAYHASPPCQRYSRMTRRWGREDRHPDLVAPIRDRLLATGKPFVIENVPGAPLSGAVALCGSMFGLSVRRHRLFEAHGFTIPALGCRHAEQGQVVGVYGHPGGSSKRDGITFGGTDVWRAAMGIDWMIGRELAESIPPAYTRHVGRLLMATMEDATMLDQQERA